MRKEIFISTFKNKLKESKLSAVKLAYDNRSEKVKSQRRLKEVKEFIDGNSNSFAVWNFIKGNKPYKLEDVT